MNVLLISSNEEAINWLALAVAIRGHSSTRVMSNPAAMSELIGRSYDLIIIDGTLCNADEHLRLCHQIRSLPKARNIAIWVVVDPDNPAQIASAIDAGASSFLSHPFDATQIRERIETLERAVASSSGAIHPCIDVDLVLESLPDVSIVVDIAGHIHAANARITSLLGFSRADLIGLNIESLIHPADVPALLERIRSTVTDIDVSMTGNVRLYRVDQQWLNAEVRCYDMRRLYSVDRILLTVRDLTAHNVQGQQLASGMLYDARSGLATIELFHEHVSRALARGERVNRPIAVLHLMLTNTAAIDDTFLTHVASQILGSIRSNDIAAQLGDDEFAVLIEDYAEVNDIDVVANRIMIAVEAPSQQHHAALAIRTEIHVVVSQPGITTVTNMLRDTSWNPCRDTAQNTDDARPTGDATDSTSSLMVENQPPLIDAIAVEEAAEQPATPEVASPSHPDLLDRILTLEARAKLLTSDKE